mmetsp:Transcript_38533/g.108943  ORF Transcript_38533/g.108943 Transcript_38533/m.108943 type:complete len:203 (-) Transcript_38533:3272-3880(-)
MEPEADMLELGVLMDTSRSPPSKLSPFSTATCFTMPATGALTVVSIFMALITTRAVPAATLVPGLHMISTISPPMGAPTLPGSLGSCFCLAALRVVPSLACLSTISTMRGMPLVSKNTSLLPFGWISPMALNLMTTEFPGKSSTSTSSSSSISWKKAVELSLLVSSLYSATWLRYSSNTFGYIAALRTSRSEMSFPVLPHFS